jgi:hypothetical protein
LLLLLLFVVFVLSACTSFGTGSANNDGPPPSPVDSGASSSPDGGGGGGGGGGGRGDSGPGGSSFCSQHPQAELCADFDDDVRTEPKGYFENVYTMNGGTASLDPSASLSSPRSLLSSATKPGQSRVWKLLGWRANKIIVEADLRVDEWDPNTGVGQAFSFIQNGIGVFLYVGKSSFLSEFRFSDGVQGKKCDIPGNPFGSKIWTHVKFELTQDGVAVFHNGPELCRLSNVNYPRSTTAQVEIGMGLAYIDVSTIKWQFRYDNVVVNPF